MFNRSSWVGLLAIDIYAALYVRRRFSREALDAEKAEELSLETEIAQVISERLETFPLEEMVDLWLKTKAKDLLHALDQFKDASVDRHLEADSHASQGVKQPWKKVAQTDQEKRNNEKKNKLPVLDVRKFKHRHQNAWVTLRDALSEYRLALGDMDLTGDMSKDQIRQLMLQDGDAVEKILSSMIAIAMTREERDHHLNSGANDTPEIAL